MYINFYMSSTLNCVKTNGINVNFFCLFLCFFSNNVNGYLQHPPSTSIYILSTATSLLFPARGVSLSKDVLYFVAYPFECLRIVDGLKFLSGVEDGLDRGVARAFVKS